MPDAPEGADVTKNTREDTPYTVKAVDFGFSDVDGDTLAAVRIDTLPTNGKLTLNGVAVTAGQEVSVGPTSTAASCCSCRMSMRPAIPMAASRSR